MSLQDILVVTIDPEGVIGFGKSITLAWQVESAGADRLTAPLQQKRKPYSQSSCLFSIYKTLHERTILAIVYYWYKYIYS